MTNLQILTKAFCRLNKESLQNLKHHLDMGTPIFCGKNADNAYFDSKGKAWPAVLAATREVADFTYHNARKALSALQENDDQEMEEDDKGTYLHTISESSQETVREAIKLATKDLNE